MVRTKRMKRLMMLGALLLIFALMGCNNAPQTPTPTTSTEPPVTPPEEPTLHPDLIDSMVKYLQRLFEEYDMPHIGEKINHIVGGMRPFHVKFSSSDYYYVCGYYKPTHVEVYYDYCCAENYTWIRFESEADILGSYNGAQLIVAFQVNKAVVCQDILQDAWDGSTMEHYQLYTPEFENGKNVTPAIPFDKEYIFLSDSDKTNLYCCEDYYLFEDITVPCVELEGKCYLIQYLYTIRLDGWRKEANLYVRFGDFYDDLKEIMITDLYSMTAENGNVYHYGLFELEEFANYLLGLDESRVNPID